MVYIRHLFSTNSERSTWEAERSIAIDRARFPHSESDLACFERQVKKQRQNPLLDALASHLSALASESVARRCRKAGSHIVFAVMRNRDRLAQRS